MRAVVVGVAAAVLAGSVSVGGLAASASPTQPHALFFSGLDFWHAGAFIHGGLLWSPGGLYQDGFTFKLLAGTGTYRYLAGALGGIEVTGFNSLASVMPGWRFKAGKFELTAYGGLDLQDHRLSPHDPGSRLGGTHVGARIGADLWYEPLPAMMLAANVSVSSI